MKFPSYPVKRENFFSIKDSIFLGIFIFLFLFLFKDFFFTDSIFYIRDMTLVEIPVRQHCAELFKTEGIPLWTDAYGNGQPFLANPKNAVFYPGTLLYLVLPFLLAFKLHFLIHAVICWLGIYVLSKSYTLSQSASFLSASAFILGGIFLSSFEFYNHIAALCWLPWILYMLNRSSEEPCRKIVMLSIFWALMILAGTPYVIVITIIFAFIQSVFAGAQKKRKTALTFLSLFLAVLLSAAQLIPSAEMLAESDRDHQNKSMWSLNFIQLPNLVFPHFLGNDRDPDVNHYWGAHLFDKEYPLYYSFYIGFGILILSFFGLKKPWDKRHIIFGTAFFIFFVLATGKNLPFYSLIQNIPPFSALRYPVKYFMGCFFSIIMLASIGYDRIFRLKILKRKHALNLIILSLASLVLFIFFKNDILSFLAKLFVLDKEKTQLALGAYIRHGFILLSVFSSLIFLSWFFKAKIKLLSWLLITVIAADLIIVNQNINPVIGISFFSKPDLIESESSPVLVYRENYLPPGLKEKLQKSIDYHNYLRKSLYPFCGLGYNLEYSFNRDFYGVYSEEYHKIFSFLENAPKEKLKTILEKTEIDYYLGHHPLPGLPASSISIEGYEFFIQKFPAKQKNVYLAYKTVKADSIEEKMKLYADQNFSPFETPIVGKEIKMKGSQPEKSEKILIIESKTNKKEYRINSPDEVIAVIPGNYHRGWKAWIDGEKAAVFKVNLMSKGIVIPSGEHEVEIKYFPSSFLYGCIISTISLFFIMIFSFMLIRKEKRIFRKC